MNQREREIGIRLKGFREGIKHSQSSFAELIGLTRDQLASVEYGRTPLKYSIAWKIRQSFGLSIDWLWGGDTAPDDLSEDRELPHPESHGIDKTALLTDVLKDFYKLSDDHLAPENPSRKVRRIQIDPQELSHRWFCGMVLHHDVDFWIASIPDGYTADFRDKIRQLAVTYLKALPQDSRDLVNARFDALLWEKMRADVAKKKPDGKGWGKIELTHTETAPISGDVQAQLPELLDRVKKATSATGKKTELAGVLKAPLASVSRWLSGEREPGGEIALKMDAWATGQGYPKRPSNKK